MSNAAVAPEREHESSRERVRRSELDRSGRPVLSNRRGTGYPGRARIRGEYTSGSERSEMVGPPR